jgi:hypothetical protein
VTPDANLEVRVNKALRDLAIQQAQVPPALAALLPVGVEETRAFLASDGYALLVQGLKAVTTVQPPNGDAPKTTAPPKDKPATPPPAKTFKDISTDALKEFDGILI